MTINRLEQVVQLTRLLLMRKELLAEEVLDVALKATIDLSHEGLPQSSLECQDVFIVKCQLCHSPLDLFQLLIRLFDVLDCQYDGGHLLVSERDDRLQPNDVWELVLDHIH